MLNILAHNCVEDLRRLLSVVFAFYRPKAVSDVRPSRHAEDEDFLRFQMLWCGRGPARGSAPFDSVTSVGHYPVTSEP
jgi:hypothetical protein